PPDACRSSSVSEAKATLVLPAIAARGAAGPGSLPVQRLLDSLPSSLFPTRGEIPLRLQGNTGGGWGVGTGLAPGDRGHGHGFLAPGDRCHGNRGTRAP